ncbi:MotA/TolQ/ExbB proton channel family protein [Govanella unica]|uniref:MotA/TolQ/ExbB proton channel family protein n=1 Tax=Govanella unica TaxID=2975056 RepID=A0A9X3TYL6_9PROT|nr:MotA/TolQ/ExbB proton channel family protein [Govania unica]MDA5193929.1 MotA/TolQ/ExbB proton channel family protein [Govania unica]
MHDLPLSLIGGLTGIGQFMSRGGMIFFWLFAITCLLWAVIAERLMYYGAGSQRDIRRALDLWRGRKERKSWYARKIRAALLSQVGLNLTRGMTVVKTLTLLCPMVGLLGTMFALIALFDRIALVGAGNVSTLAGDLARAAIPAMAGMVVALSGVLAGFYLTRRAAQAVTLLEDRLGLDR